MDYRTSTAELHIGNRSWRLEDFLIAPLSGNSDLELVDTWHRFVRAGMAAVERTTGAESWAQFGVALPAETRPACYAALADTATNWLADGVVDNFFFMHKPPGFRVRFQTKSDTLPSVREMLHKRLATWRNDGLVREIVPGVYEPEQVLFGGPAAMAHVHRLFTLDSLAWLDFHRTDDARPAWAYSLALLREVATGLGIVGWEDLEVWDRIRRQGGRQLRSGLTADRVAAASAGIRAAWASRATATAALSETALKAADRHREAVATAARDWLDGYFATDHAVIGPREAMAFLVIFHWNRGGLSRPTQSLVTTALADRTARP